MKGPPSAPRPGLGPRRPVAAALGSARPSAGAPPLAALLHVPLGWRIADVYLVLAGFLFLELCAVGLLRARELAGAYELGRAVLYLLPIALACAAPAAVVGALVVELVLHAQHPRARAVLAAIAALFAAAVAVGVSGGRHFDLLGRIAFAAALSLVAALAAFLAGPRLAALLRLAPRMERRWAIPAGAMLVVVGIEIANARVLPRLYPAFHVGLMALTLATASFVTVAWSLAEPTRRPERERPAAPVLSTPKLRRVAATLVLFALAAAVAPGAARRLAPADNIRLLYLDHAPVLGYAVAVGARLAPPPPLADEPLLPVLASGQSVDMSGRDVLLVSIDALRADHVGAYGYPRPITPHLDRLAAEGVVFEAAYTPTPHTSYAVTSLMTGKYVRPLVLQGLGEDSETWAAHLRRYGYKTAAFYPPAVFFIDGDRLATFRDRALDFEYRKVQFATAEARAAEVRAYLEREPAHQRIFMWVHLFEPHEPYEAHPSYQLGDRDIDRYDAEVAAADAGLGAIVRAMRASRPNAVIIVTADHGEEFLEHGGRYHGTTVYEEQVRVPLVVSAPGLTPPRRVGVPVQLTDLLPTVLSGLAVPRPARVRGADLGALLAGKGDPGKGFAFSETDTQTLVARGSLRLVCARKLGACALYDVARDPRQLEDVGPSRPAELTEMRAELRAVEASHGRYEVRGLREEGKGWPEALRRGIAGDGDAVTEVAALLEDADAGIRRKAAEVLFELKRPEAAAALRLAVVRDEDDEVRRWGALALTRLGEGAARTRELVEDRDPRWRRLAALALAESGDDRGEDVLIAWWREAYPGEGDRDKPRKPIPFERAREIAEALARIKAKAAVVPLCDGLDDIRLRPHLARALAQIGQDAARPALATRLETERYQTARVAMTEALVQLGAGPELWAPLIRLLGTPDPLPGGLGFAIKADLLELIGGPKKRDLERLRRFATSGIAVGVVIPKAGNGSGVRVICRAKTTDDRAGEIRVGMRAGGMRLPAKGDKTSLVPRDAPELDPKQSVALVVPATRRAEEPFATLPTHIPLKAGHWADLVFYATQNVEVEACAAVPLSDEIPPPPPEPWQPSAPQKE